jgi:hypothetical protein
MSLNRYRIVRLFRTAIAGFILLAIITGALPVSHTTSHAGHHHHDETSFLIELSETADDENTSHHHASANEHNIGFLAYVSAWQHRVSVTERLPLFAELHYDQDFLYEHERPPREYRFV